VVTRFASDLLVQTGVRTDIAAVVAAIELAAAFGVGTVVVRRSHHIACLAAYLHQATDIGLIPLIATSDPNSALVAPHGGSDAVLTPNPIAAGIPSSGDPILVDISTSMTSKNEASRADPPEGRGTTVFIQVIDPAAFAGTKPFNRQVDWIAHACHRSVPQQGRPAVRLPGEAGLRRRRQQLSAGVDIDRGTWRAMTDRARKLGIPAPTWSA
jgi:LDH2 family malate/lactate/ureidoglycolate dehydrogenase